MTIYHDDCTAGPLSGWLDGMIAGCCAAHDLALDHSTDIGTFMAGNWQLFECVRAGHPVLAVAVLVAVAGPIGLALYFFGPKRKADRL